MLRLIRHNWKILFVGISQLVDLLAMICAALVLLGTRHYNLVTIRTPDADLATCYLIFVAVYITIAAMMGLYRGSYHLSLSLQNLIMARAFILCVLVTLTIVSAIDNLYIGRHALVIFLFSLPVFFVLGRVLLRRVNLLFQKWGYGVHNSLIVGYDQDAFKIYQRFSSFPELGYKIKGFVVREKNSASTLQPQYTLAQFDEVIASESIDRVFIPSPEMVVNGYASLKKKGENHPIKLKILSPQAEELLKIARIYDIAGITLTAPPRYHVDAIKLFIKRLFDIVGSTVAIILFSPIFLVTIVAIYLESGRPFFFLQTRASIKGGKQFDFIKFRSMIEKADQMKDELWGHNESDGALFKMKNDPRITKVGRIIRKLSIDELPQLFNVLKGDMSLVGPRPLPLSDFDTVNEPDEFWETIQDRAAVKPGMTGLWQVSGRSDIKFREMILLDLYYVENHSLLFDLEIMFETVPVVLFGKGAY
ncbi:MAG TPA: sugar transferase [Bacteroidota bacterium]|nr:sugar transferase [Bacteroidota bacterium]